MMDESRLKQEDLQKAEEKKNAARKSRNRTQVKGEKGLTDVRSFWKMKESELAKQGDLERLNKDTVVVDRKRKNTGIDNDLRGAWKKGCMEGGRGIAAATDAAVDRKKSETDRNFKLKLTNKYYPASSSSENTGGGGVQVGGDAELVEGKSPERTGQKYSFTKYTTGV